MIPWFWNSLRLFWITCTASPIGATKEVLSLVKYACESILSPQGTLVMECKKISDEAVKTHCNGKLNTKSVQGKFEQVCELESQNRVWNRIIDGLPANQLSFILWAGSDTLPTLLICEDGNCVWMQNVLCVVVHLQLFYTSLMGAL